MIRIAAAIALIAGAAVAIFIIYGRGDTDRPVLDLPVDCEMGERCYIQSHVDRDPGPGFADFTCGSLSYDGHKGVDFRVATFAEMEKGVDIIAAAAGKVRATRDGVDDLGAQSFPAGKDCGNAVVLTHGSGWETQYCHLAKGTVAVRDGDHVEAGDKLGQMGFSGKTEFPHLHLSIRQDGEPVDPFGAQRMAQVCDVAETDSLWSASAQRDLAYQPGGVVDIGISDAPPMLAAIRQGDQNLLTRANSDSLIMWARFFGVRTDDTLSMQLFGPDGEVISNSTDMAKNRAEEMRYAGRRSATGWPKGRYRAIATIIRAGRPFDMLEQEFTLN